jgi:hypothetical protein
MVDSTKFPVIFPVHGNSAGAQGVPAGAFETRVAVEDEAGVVIGDRDLLSR